MISKTNSPGLALPAILFVALALSIGWGVRGNWGHEYGAMIPGALSAMGVVLVSGRDDWYRRIPFFALFGALGWSFGGSISYMHVIAYTHSGDALSVFYGFACLFLIGFVWGAMGGAGTALPAFLNRERLTELLIPVSVVLIAWLGQDLFMNVYLAGLQSELKQGLITQDQWQEQTRWIHWHDTDWLAVIVAGAAAMALAVVRRRVCWGTSLVLHMCAGWWLGFTVLTIGMGLRMTPPRGDNWAGALGMTIAMFVFLYRQRELGITWTALVTGFFGGLGFTGATLIKLVLIHPGFQESVFGGPTSSNYHSILEQTFGFIAGIGVALALGYLAPRTPRRHEEPLVRRWAEPLAVFFVLLVITYVNIVKNLEAVWLKNGTVQELLWGHSSHTWFNLGYLALAATVAWPLIAHYRGREIALLPSSWLGRGQILFIVFLWWIIVGNAARTVPFHEQRLITEGVIHINACLCTLMALLLPGRKQECQPGGEISPINYSALVQKTVLAGAMAIAVVVVGEFGIVRAMWGDSPASHASLHIRFGPNATLDKK